jgi:hypothetical protein
LLLSSSSSSWEWVSLCCVLLIASLHLYKHSSCMRVYYFHSLFCVSYVIWSSYLYLGQGENDYSCQGLSWFLALPPNLHCTCFLRFTPLPH